MKEASLGVDEPNDGRETAYGKGRPRRWSSEQRVQAKQYQRGRVHGRGKTDFFASRPPDQDWEFDTD